MVMIAIKGGIVIFSCSKAPKKKYIPYGLRKVVIEGMVLSFHQTRNPRAWILPFWFKTVIDSLKQNLCLAPDQKMVRAKKVANDQKINLAS